MTASSKRWRSLTNNERFAYDSYRRLINMFGDTVMGVDHEHFEHELSEVKHARGVKLDTDLDTDGLKEVVRRYKTVYEQHVGSPFPEDPMLQLEHSIEAVFKSWMGDRAIHYRQINEIRGLFGTAVNVQTMVFGNMGDDSPPASPSPATPAPAKISSSASSSSTPRAKTWSPASARRSTARRNWPSGRRRAGRSC